MELHGKNFIGNTLSAKGTNSFNAFNPAINASIDTSFTEATVEEVNEAAVKAKKAFLSYRNKSGIEKAAFLEKIADEILQLGDGLIHRCMEETGLPEGRLVGERGRTMNQLKLFAQMLRKGSWVDARIDHADPSRQPVPKPDTRSMERALGPVGIFGASNFPLAFSVAGGDTASALAAGCPLVVKAHPAHPGTCEMVASAIIKAINATGMPEGVFSMVHGKSVEVGMAIVKNEHIKAIGFTGSFWGGKAIFDAANARPEPIPVYAEMGSTNPVFILPEALKQRKEDIAKNLTASVTLGTGQFCTNPGMVLLEESDEKNEFVQLFSKEMSGASATTMLTEGIRNNYDNGVKNLSSSNGVSLIARGKESSQGVTGQPYAFETTSDELLANEHLEEEVFGPSTLLVGVDKRDSLLKIANKLKGHLTITVHGTENDLKNYADLISLLELKAGRLIINGYPTGVEVCHSMVHGGPFPATTDSRSTSVGTLAIKRFTRPVCYQNFPAHLLPDELKEDNPLKILRLVDGEYK